MSKITEEEFFTIIHKPKDECDGYEIHLQYCWNNNRAKSIFYLTGLNFQTMLGEEKNDLVKSPSIKTLIIPPIYE